MHLCFGNSHRPSAEHAVFKDLRKEFGFGLGVVDIKRNMADGKIRALLEGRDLYEGRR